MTRNYLVHLYATKFVISNGIITIDFQLKRERYYFEHIRKKIKEIERLKRVHRESNSNSDTLTTQLPRAGSNWSRATHGWTIATRNLNSMPFGPSNNKNENGNYDNKNKNSGNDSDKKNNDNNNNKNKITSTRTL